MIDSDDFGKKRGEVQNAIHFLQTKLNSYKTGKHKGIFVDLLSVAAFAQSKIESINFQLTSIETVNSIIILCNRISEYVTALIDGQDNVINPIKEEISNLLTKLPLLVTTNTINLNQSQEFLLKLQADAQKSFDNVQIKLNENIVESKKHLEKLKGLEDEGKTQVQILAGNVLKNDYQRRAKEEWDKSQTWTRWTVILAITTVVCIVAILVYQLILGKQDEYNFQLLGTKFLIIATLGLIAKWTSKRATRHLAEESKYHRLAVNIATIKPFTDALTGEAKDKVLSDIAVKIFTDGTGNEISTEYESNSLDFLKGLLPKSDR